MANSKYIIIDNKTYQVPIVELQRKGDILDLTANRTEDGVLHREVIGTYYNYTLKIGIVNDPELYEELWNVLTAPVASHMIELPHDHVQFEGYFGSCQDNITMVTEDGYKAKGLSFNLVATRAARTAVNGGN